MPDGLTSSCADQLAESGADQLADSCTDQLTDSRTDQLNDSRAVQLSDSRAGQFTACVVVMVAYLDRAGAAPPECQRHSIDILSFWDPKLTGQYCKLVSSFEAVDFANK